MNFVAGFGWLGHHSTVAGNILARPHGGYARAKICRLSSLSRTRNILPYD